MENWRKKRKRNNVNLWKQIANGLKDYDEHLVFESNNEVNYDEIYDFDDDYNDDYDGEYYDDEYYDDEYYDDEYYDDDNDSYDEDPYYYDDDDPVYYDDEPSFEEESSYNDDDPYYYDDDDPVYYDDEPSFEEESSYTYNDDDPYYYDDDDHNYYDDDDDFFINYDKIKVINSTQAFIDIIRNTVGLNAKRLLIISGFNTELELTYTIKYKMPIDPANKTAISLHYYIPSEYLNYMSDFYEEYMEWADVDGDHYEGIPKTKWGSTADYKELVTKFDILKYIFTDKNIPVIIGEVGMLTEQKRDLDSIKEFLYAILSVSANYKGIMTCLWDISEKI